MRYLSLFSGIESASVAWEPLGWTPVAFAEIDKFACSVLEHRYPHVPNLGDVTKITEADLAALGPVDLVVGGSPCFPAESLVLTKNGYMPISDIEVGDEVLTHRARWKKVTRVGGSYKHVVSLKGYGHPDFRASYDHPIWMREKHFFRDAENKTTRSVMSAPEWVDAEDAAGLFWASPNHIPDDDFFTNTDDINLWWIIGRWVADGWVRDGERRGHGGNWSHIFLGIGKHKVDAVEERLAKLGIKFSKFEEKTVVKFRWWDQELCSRLKEEFGYLAHGKRIPGYLFRKSRDVKQSFIDGYLSGDGWKKGDGVFTATTVSKELAHGIRLLSETLGFYSRVYLARMPKTCVIEGRTCNQKHQWKVVVDSRPLVCRRSAVRDDKHTWGKVREVSDIGEMPVFNLEVEDDNTYVVENVVVHNCQDLSNAGRRAGLDGERSGLFHEQIRIFHAARFLCGARFLLWENVPGAFSSNRGRDFAVVVGAMAGAEFGVPKRKWQNAGAALGRNGLVEWRCLDAEYVCVESHPFAVPQRRKRVFALLDTGDWRSRSPLLLERQGCEGNPAPRRGAGQAATRDVAPSLTGSGRGTERVGESRGQDALIPVVSPTITANTHRGIDSDCCGQPLIVHTLTAEGHDASEDGSGRGTPIVLVNVLALEIRTRDSGLNLEYRDDGVANALRGSNGGRCGMGAGAIAFSCMDSASDSGPVSPPLRALNHHNSHANAGGQVAVAFAENSRAATAMSVRRITPLEAERLQGFPDGWTKVPYRGRPAEKCPDGPRYRALGNAMAVNCMQWIGKRIDAITQQEF